MRKGENLMQMKVKNLFKEKEKEKKRRKFNANESEEFI